MRTKVIWVTPQAEQIVTYCARVSNPSNQDNLETAPKLLGYCIKNKHWSVFEMASLCVEIETSRAISAQILRHRSFSFQEFSQRYAASTEFELYDARSQDVKNRQNSVDDLDDHNKEWFRNVQLAVNKDSHHFYHVALSRGIAKECARFLLPLSTQTKVLMTGSIRSRTHYLQLRTANGTQLEHKVIADSIQQLFCEQFPQISTALNWS